MEIVEFQGNLHIRKGDSSLFGSRTFVLECRNSSAIGGVYVQVQEWCIKIYISHFVRCLNTRNNGFVARRCRVSMICNENVSFEIGWREFVACFVFECLPRLWITVVRRCVIWNTLYMNTSRCIYKYLLNKKINFLLIKHQIFVIG